MIPVGKPLGYECPARDSGTPNLRSLPMELSSSPPTSTSQQRCFWCDGVPEFAPYHDSEWGFPTSSDRDLFEKITLESFQSGLSWRTILNKREEFRSAFANFEVEEIAQFGPRDVDRLLQNASIVRHRGKIEATVNNASRALEMIVSHGSLGAFFWQFESKDAQARTDVSTELVQQTTSTPEALQLSKTLKRLGWKFVGPTTVYAFMQSAGIVNDHTNECFVRSRAIQARRSFKLPLSSPSANE